MIEALNINMIDPKALEKVNGEKTQESDASGEFANALEAMLVPVEGGEELTLPSELVKQAAESQENGSPKVFNSNLINNVNKLLSPESAEAAIEMEGVDPKVLQSLLKTPVVVAGRAPAVELSNAEVDPQLLNFEDFVEQKNLQAKKPVTEAYGLKINAAEKEAAKIGLKETQVVSEVAPLQTEAPVNSQQFILNMLSDKAPEATVSEVASVPKVFDMNNIKTNNTNEIINQITDYVIQAKASKEPTVHMRFNHDDLGMVDLHVSKVTNSDSIAVNIGAHSLEGKNFFQQNAKELLSHLASTGHTVTDMKVETPSQMAKSDFDFGSQLGRGQQGQDKQFGSEQNQRRHEQERRADLWKALNQEAA